MIRLNENSGSYAAIFTITAVTKLKSKKNEHMSVEKSEKAPKRLNAVH